MHVHIGVPSADDAIRICAWLTQRAPLFIALSANSPCWQLMAHGGQAGWLKVHMDKGSGMNDLARVASEMFAHPQ